MTVIEDGTRIEVEPASKLTDADQADIRDNKHALLAIPATREAATLLEAPKRGCGLSLPE
jgi:hypothetical protein